MLMMMISAKVTLGSENNTVLERLSGQDYTGEGASLSESGTQIISTKPRKDYQGDQK